MYFAVVVINGIFQQKIGDEWIICSKIRGDKIAEPFLVFRPDQSMIDIFNLEGTDNVLSITEL